MHVDKIYDQSRFSKIEGLITQMSGYFYHLQEVGFLIDFDYHALAEHVNSLALVIASEFITGEIYGIPIEQSVRAFSRQYAAYFTKLFSTKEKH